MNTRRIFFAAVIASVIAMISLPPRNISAQSINSTVSAVITSASGAERHLIAYDHYLGRVGLRPGQLVTVALQFADYVEGTPMTMASLDGGEVSTINNGPAELFISSAGSVGFHYRGGYSPGLYRLIVSPGVDDYRLEFYVLDVEHLESNPPRVRIVD